MGWYLQVLQKYAVFNGRAQRAELWMFLLINAIIDIILRITGVMVGVGAIISLIYNFIIILPYLAVWSRRMHDIGKSGWFMLIPIYNIVLGATDGTPGDNRFGSDPKARIKVDLSAVMSPPPEEPKQDKTITPEE